MILDLLFPKQCLECKKQGKYICDSCISKVTPCGKYGNNISIFRYEGVMRKAIISLKYKFATDIADELVDLCVRKLNSNHCFLNPILVPIPLHKHRENWRGFNQAEIIGKKLARIMDWEFVPDLLIRTKNTQPQVGLKGLARRSNLSDVFCLNPSCNLSTVINNLVLFDDVYTTGSTINEAKKVLRDAGFRNIKSLTIAR
jgi:ComF family protein